MNTDPTARECDNCGGRIVPMATSRTGYRHAPDLPECEVKPPLPAYTVDELITEWVAHPAARQQIRAELERLREAALNAEADALVRQAELKGMSVEDGAALLELGPPRELVIAWVHAAREMLGDAPNYSETRIDFPKASASMEVKAAGEVDRYVFTVQRAGKVTPHEARQNAEAERDEMRARDEAAKAVVEAWNASGSQTTSALLIALDALARAHEDGGQDR